MRALFTTVELGVALRAVAGQIGFRGQGGGAVETPRSGDMLHQPGETGAGHVQGRTRALRFGPVVAKALALARVHVPVLSVFAIAIHGESYSVLMGEKNVAYSRSELFAPVVKMPTAPTRPQDRPRDNGWVVGLPEGLDGGSEGSANNRPQPASASTTYVPRNGHGLHARFATAYPTELHFIKDEQGRVRGSS